MTSKERKYGTIIADKVYFIKQLDSLGIDKNYTGYFMLVDIESMLVNQKDRVFSFSKEIYPIVAKKYNKAEFTVERNIRNLIDKCWTMELMEKLNHYLPDGQKPTCRDFIYMIKNFIIYQLFKN
ncbi:MAG: sporulation initiation factor Spo0A C-terminal domain-containing protein [Clostridia bacterium]|nr:sporulation initiation factor Spo0A C-terminal domain-containing protein [Clostridia bacterium]